MGKSQIRWGVLGCSNISIGKIIPSVKMLTNAKITALASRQEEKARHYSDLNGIDKYYGSYSMLLDDADIDAIYISLPNSMHCEWSIKASRKGKHVLCEKPAGLNPKEVAGAINACRENKVLYLEGLMYRFHPQHHRVKQLIAQGAIGDIKLIRSSFSYLLTDRHSKIKVDKSLGGGCLYDIGCYCVDLSRWIFEKEPINVHSFLYKPEDQDVDMSAIGILGFPDNGKAVFDCSFEMTRRNCYEVVGIEGRIEVPMAFTVSGPTVIRVFRNSVDCEVEKFPMIDQYAEQFNHFSDCILNGKDTVIPLENSVRCSEVLIELMDNMQMQ